jgi:7-cyano-7-deazaguanosine (preQ0) biosynthesis protein QueE
VTVALVVSEVFGPTVQGEGPSTGRRCGFVRLGRCNQACSFCDTPYTWDWDRFEPAVELHETAVDDVLVQLDAMDVDMVVVTGGEPLLQQRALEALLGAVKGRGWRVEIETAGTIAPTMADGLVDQWNVSPKLANSGNPLERRYKPDVLRAFEATGNAIFKFVACEPSDLDEVDAMVEECALGDVWIMPEGTDAATLERRSGEVAEDVIKRGWNLTTRLHILVWGNRRGV